MKKPGLIAAMALVGIVAWHAPAWAKVTIQGNVRFFDQTNNTYRPAHNVDVTVDGSWFGGDPCVTTDDNGFYSTSVDDPWPGTWFNVFVNAATRVGGCNGPARFQVKRMLLSPTTYVAASAQKSNIHGGETATVDLNIAGPDNNEQANCTFFCYATSKEIANAFLVTDELESHWRKLRELGFVNDGMMQNLVVVVPAWSMATSFTNVLMNAINIVAYANSSPTLGLDNWDNLATGTDRDYNGYSYFLGGVRHELSHYTHGLLTGPNFPPGLLTAANHCSQEQSSQNLAFTEGFAEFLPMVSIPIPNGGLYGPTGGFDFTTKCNGDPGNDISDHAAVEGEVAGLLWHLFSPLDPAAPRDRVRRMAKEADDGTSLMGNNTTAIRVAQVWTDRIEDPNLSKIRAALQSGPANTINDLLRAFLAANPDVHALKTIAINRDIDLADHPENPAGVDGDIRITWSDLTATTGKITLSFKVKEPDSEDQPFVHLAVFHQHKDMPAIEKTQVDLTSGWNGDQIEVSTTFQVRLPEGATTPNVCTEDQLWIMANDEMMPRVAHLCVPGPPSAPDATTTSGGPTLVQAGRPWGKAIDKRLLQLRQIFPSRPPKPWGSGQELADLRGLFNEAQHELADYGNRRQLVQLTDFKLYKLGHDLGRLKAPGAGPTSQFSEPVWARKGKSLGGTATRQLASAGLQEYNQWLSQAAISKAAPAAAQKGLQAHRELLARAIAAQNAAPALAAKLDQQLAAASQALHLPEDAAGAGKLIDQQVQEIRQALTASAKDDGELSAALQARYQVLQTLTSDK